jgi:hypothetical protein
MTAFILLFCAGLLAICYLIGRFSSVRVFAPRAMHVLFLLGMAAIAWLAVSERSRLTTDTKVGLTIFFVILALSWLLGRIGVGYTLLVGVLLVTFSVLFGVFTMFPILGHIMAIGYLIGGGRALFTSITRAADGHAAWARRN